MVNYGLQVMPKHRNYNLTLNDNDGARLLWYDHYSLQLS
ncbi:hypothetical protein BLKGLAD_73080 (plasmid) [Burkholderia gladioli pv. gladioli]